MPIGQLLFSPSVTAWEATIGLDSYIICNPTSTSTIALANPTFFVIYLGSGTFAQVVGSPVATYAAAVTLAQNHFTALAT
jgi:hypothetical protein